MSIDATQTVKDKHAAPEPKAVGTAGVGDVTNKGAVTDQPGAADKPQADKLTDQGSWFNRTLAEASALYNSASSLFTGTSDAAAVTKVNNLDSLPVGDIWSSLKATPASFRTPDDGGQNPKLDSLLGTQVDRESLKWLTAGVDGPNDKRMLGTAIGSDGVIHSNAMTKHGQKVHADVRGGETHVEVADAKVDVDRKAHTTDYTSGEWTGHIENGKGEITNKKTGTTISYDGHEYIAKDKPGADGKIIAQSSNPKELQLELRGMHVHVGHGQTETESQEEQQRQKAAGVSDTKAFQDPKTGDWAIVNKDVIIRTNKAEHYVQITNDEGQSIRMRRGDDGRNHFYQMANGKEQELTHEQREAFGGDKLKLDHQLGVTQGAQNLVGNDLTVRPTEDAQIGPDGQLRGKDIRGQDVTVTDLGNGNTKVQDGDLSWQTGRGMRATGDDGSCVGARNFNNPSFQIMEPDGTTSSLGMDNTLSMFDPSGDNLYMVDSNGTSVFADDSFTNNDGGLTAGTDSDSYTGGYGQGTAGYEAADAAEDSACLAADVNIDYVSSKSDGEVTPECGGKLEGSAAKLENAIAKCLMAGNFDAANDAQGELDKVNMMRAAVAPKVAEARELAADGITSPFLVAQAQKLSGFTPEGAILETERLNAA